MRNYLKIKTIKTGNTLRKISNKNKVDFGTDRLQYQSEIGTRFNMLKRTRHCTDVDYVMSF
jgi:hypothetical protein